MSSPLAQPDRERYVLGIALHDESRFLEATALLRPGDFSLDSHRRIFSAMLELSASGTRPDEIAIVDILGRHNQLKAVGGASYISELFTNHVPGSNLEQHARNILDSSRRRQLINACERVKAAAEDATEDTAACYAMAQDALLEIEADSRQQKSARRIGEILPEAIRQLEIQAAQKGLVGLSTGIPELDRRTTGIREGELWVVGALTGRGKTCFGLQALRANAARGVPGAMFSLEMSQFQLACRTLAALSGVDAATVRDPQFLNKADWEALAQAQAEAKDWPLYIDDAGSLRLSELVARARLYVRRHGVKLVVIDYLMLVQAPGKELRERADAVTEAMRQLAKAEKVGVILLSQLRRPPDVNARPTLTDFKESGGIENAAHVALGLYRPIDEQSNRFTGEDEVVIVKQREGAYGALPVHFNEDRLEFVDRCPEVRQ